MDSISNRKDAWSVIDDEESDMLDLLAANAMMASAPRPRALRPRTRIGAEPTLQTKAMVPVPSAPVTFAQHCSAAFDGLPAAAKIVVVVGCVTFAAVALGWLVGASAKAAAVSAAAAL